jgi:hypothetical protein
MAVQGSGIRGATRRIPLRVEPLSLGHQEVAEFLEEAQGCKPLAGGHDLSRPIGHRLEYPACVLDVGKCNACVWRDARLYCGSDLAQSSRNPRIVGGSRAGCGTLHDAKAIECLLNGGEVGMVQMFRLRVLQYLNRRGNVDVGDASGILTCHVAPSRLCGSVKGALRMRRCGIAEINLRAESRPEFK